MNSTIGGLSSKQKHRISETAFTRKRSLDFPTLILYLLNLRKHSNQTELDQFFKTIQNEKLASQVITKSAFFQARKQLSHTALPDLNQQLNRSVKKVNGSLKHGTISVCRDLTK